MVRRKYPCSRRSLTCRKFYESKVFFSGKTENLFAFSMIILPWKISFGTSKETQLFFSRNINKIFSNDKLIWRLKNKCKTIKILKFETVSCKKCTNCHFFNCTLWILQDWNYFQAENADNFHFFSDKSSQEPLNKNFDTWIMIRE